MDDERIQRRGEYSHLLFRLPHDAPAPPPPRKGNENSTLLNRWGDRFVLSLSLFVALLVYLSNRSRSSPLARCLSSFDAADRGQTASSLIISPEISLASLRQRSARRRAGLM